MSFEKWPESKFLFQNIGVRPDAPMYDREHAERHIRASYAEIDRLTADLNLETDNRIACQRELDRLTAENVALAKAAMGYKGDAIRINKELTALQGQTCDYAGCIRGTIFYHNAAPDKCPNCNGTGRKTQPSGAALRAALENIINLAVPGMGTEAEIRDVALVALGLPPIATPASEVKL